MKEAEANLQAVMRFCSGDMNAIIWIEPGMTAVRNEFLAKILAVFGRIARFVRTIAIPTGAEESSAKYQSPLVAGLTPRVNALVIPALLHRDI